MKKLFAVILCMVLIFSLVTTCAMPATSNAQPVSSTTTSTVSSQSDEEKNNEDKDDEDKNEVLSLEYLSKVSSWEDLTSTNLTVVNSHSKPEDTYVKMFIRDISQKKKMPIYHDIEYVSECVAGIRLDEINYDQLMQKFQTVINLYNKSNELQLTFEPHILNEILMEVNVSSTNIAFLKASPTRIGTLVLIRDGAKYWESSHNDGSGKYGVATSENHYIPKDFVVMINGFAYFDESKTNVVEHFYTPYNEIEGNGEKIKLNEPRMLHICTEAADLGWVYAEDVINCK